MPRRGSTQPMTAMLRYWAAAIALALSGCSATSVGISAGAATTVAASEERGLTGTVSDTALEAEINALLLQHDFATFRNVGVHAYEGRVLMAGLIETPETRVDAVRLAWRVDGVKEVINEIEVSDGGGAEAYARDVWISTRLRTTLLLDKEIKSINYSVETVSGTVFLIGYARSAEELARVEAHARNLSYVRRVVNYVRVEGESS